MCCVYVLQNACFDICLVHEELEYVLSLIHCLIRCNEWDITIYNAHYHSRRTVPPIRITAMKVHIVALSLVK